jgi:hypothetical protein
MADFPIDLTNATDNVTDVLAKHLNNLEAKVGVDNSAVTTSLDYKVAHDKFTWKGDWSVSSVAYDLNDTVQNDGSGYVCTSAHTSGATTEPGVGASWTDKWDLFVEGTDKTMPTGDIVGTTDTQTLTNKKVQLTAELGSDHTASGTTILLTATANVAFGDVCYIASTGKASLIDADAIASMSAIVMAIATISADASGEFLLMGIARDDTWAWTVGGLIYGSVTGTTGNTLTQTAPSGTDDVVQIMGVATHADRMYFNPQLVQIERT